MSNSTSNSTAPGEADHNLYGYNPSKAAAYAYVTLFALSGFIHFIFMFRLRAAFFIPLVLGCAMEAGGYYCRAWSSADTHKILPFVVQGLLILAAPPLLAATIYMTFGRIIRNLEAEAYSLISPRWLTKLFVFGDFACLVSQLAGSVLSASTDLQTNKNGSHIILGGLILQVVMFSFFTLLTWTFHTRFSRLDDGIHLPWRKHIAVLFTLSTLFIIRNIVRIVEYLQGSNGFITTHEVMLYICDGTFMLFVPALLIFIHPGQLFREARRAKKINKWGLSNKMTPIVNGA